MCVSYNINKETIICVVIAALESKFLNFAFLRFRSWVHCPLVAINEFLHSVHMGKTLSNNNLIYKILPMHTIKESITYNASFTTWAWNNVEKSE